MKAWVAMMAVRCLYSEGERARVYSVFRSFGWVMIGLAVIAWCFRATIPDPPHSR